MRVVIQRVSEASVTIEEIVRGAIGKGLLVLVGIEESDSLDDIEWLCKKIVNMRIFDDEKGVMNLSLKDIDGEVLVVSQFTLFAQTAKGNRPSYIRAANHNISIPLYEGFCSKLRELVNKPIQTGQFGANMDVALHNDGPVTIWLDSKNRSY